MNKRLLIVPTVSLLTGCGSIVEFISGNSDTIDSGAGMLSTMGPYGAIAALAITTITGVVSSKKHKKQSAQHEADKNQKEYEFSDLVKGFQKAKKKLDPKALEALQNELKIIVPSHVQKLVDKVKGKK